MGKWGWAGEKTWAGYFLGGFLCAGALQKAAAGPLPATLNPQPHLWPLNGQSASEAETALLSLLHQGFPVVLSDLTILKARWQSFCHCYAKTLCFSLCKGIDSKSWYFLAVLIDHGHYDDQLYHRLAFAHKLHFPSVALLYTSSWGAFWAGHADLSGCITCSGCYSRVPQSRWLNIIYHSLTVLQARRLKSRCQQDRVPSEDCRQGSFRSSFLASGGGPQFLAAAVSLHSPLPSLCGLLSRVSISPFPFPYKNDEHPNPIWLHLTLVTSAKPLFPDKVTVTGPGGEGFR